MTFASVFIIVITSGIVFVTMGYRWGKRDAVRAGITQKKQANADQA